VDEVRWLDAEEQRTWRAFLAAVRRIGDDLERQLQRGAGMPHTYYLVLAMLSESDNWTASMTDLATLTGASASRLSHAMNRLEDQGWVKRNRCAGNGRIIMATLTEAGFETLKSTAPGHVCEVRRVLFDRLSREQVQQLYEISQAISADPD
jgi:DNA-binding MarR family transcriptional regulator